MLETGWPSPEARRARFGPLAGRQLNRASLEFRGLGFRVWGFRESFRGLYGLGRVGVLRVAVVEALGFRLECHAGACCARSHRAARHFADVALDL